MPPPCKFPLVICQNICYTCKRENFRFLTIACLAGRCNQWQNVRSAIKVFAQGTKLASRETTFPGEPTGHGNPTSKMLKLWKTAIQRLSKCVLLACAIRNTQKQFSFSLPDLLPAVYSNSKFCLCKTGCHSRRLFS